MPERALDLEGPIDGEMRKGLDDLRLSLMRLHKALLDYEREHYEAAFGRVPSPGDLLQLLLNDKWFEWLRPLSGLIVQIDVLIEADEPATPKQKARETIAYTRAMVTPSETGGAFAGNYFLALQREPAVVLAHAEVRRLLGRLG